MAMDATHIPNDSQILTRDDVTAYLLDIRHLNDGIDNRRKELMEDYTDQKYKELRFTFLEGYDKWKEGHDTNVLAIKKARSDVELYLLYLRKDGGWIGNATPYIKIIFKNVQKFDREKGFALHPKFDTYSELSSNCIYLYIEPEDRWQSIACLYGELYGTAVKDISKNPVTQKTELLVQNYENDISTGVSTYSPIQTSKKEKNTEIKSKNKKTKRWTIVAGLLVLSIIGSIGEKVGQLAVETVQTKNPSSMSSSISTQHSAKNKNALIAELFAFLTTTEHDALELISEAKSEIASITPEDLDTYNTDDKSRIYVDTKVDNAINICRQLHSLGYISDQDLGDMLANIITFLFNLIKINNPSVVFIYDRTGERRCRFGW